MDVSNNYASVDYTCTAANVNINQPNTSLIISTNNHPGHSFDEITAFKVSDQKVIYLPRIFNELKNLRVLKIDRSFQKYLLKDDLKSSRHLLELSLSNGEIEEIDGGTFENAFDLKYISIEHHRILHLPTPLFKNLALLKYVSFRNNFLTTLNDNLFLKNNMLENIFFDNNNLTVIGGLLLQNQKQVKRISFLNNVCINKEFPKTLLMDLVNTFYSQCKEDQKEYRMKLERKNVELEAHLIEQFTEHRFTKHNLQECEINKTNCERDKALNYEAQAIEADNKYKKCTTDNELEVQKVTDLKSQVLILKQSNLNTQNLMIISEQNFEKSTQEIHNLKLEIVALKKELLKRSFRFKCFNQSN
ncbi:unnamed protein product [Diamesa tonsa]